MAAPLDAAFARRMWQRFELIHDLTYFSPHVLRRAADLGLRGFWMGYFAMRSAPLGPVDPAVVTATFSGFHRSRVDRALPDAWSYTTPAAAIAAREAGVDAALAELVPALELSEAMLAEAADLAWLVAQAADTAGRPLAAANQALPRPPSSAAALWQATAVLREHRGDGHVAVLVGRGVRPVEAHWLKIAARETDAKALEVSRGFPAEEWQAGSVAVAERGWVDPSGALTDAGRAEHAAIETATDLAAIQPWADFGSADSGRLLALLDPIARAVVASGVIPAYNPVGLPVDDLENDRLS